ncbi:hypothetical protein [Nesterenkonia marinintestina]|uniref:hypothetical protein n=1 Tax=Nesterenkonia marinintestina TaxID=2979865 RepID=UPI0021C066EB|nr:hypothetical protein [Nesterenkonia sp. GX14115]
MRLTFRTICPPVLGVMALTACSTGDAERVDQLEAEVSELRSQVSEQAADPSEAPEDAEEASEAEDPDEAQTTESPAAEDSGDDPGEEWPRQTSSESVEYAPSRSSILDLIDTMEASPYACEEYWMDDIVFDIIPVDPNLDGEMAVCDDYLEMYWFRHSAARAQFEADMELARRGTAMNEAVLASMIGDDWALSITVWPQVLDELGHASPEGVIDDLRETADAVGPHEELVLWN